MLEIPEEIKKLYRRDNISPETAVKIRLKFYDDEIDTLYPYETLWPAEDLYPAEHEGDPWLLIENNRIETESLTLTESLSSSDDMEFGSCEGSTFEIVVADVNEDVTGREFTATVEVGGYEMAFGIYTVESYVRQADRRKRKITAYDRMRKFDTDVAGWYNELVFPMTVKKFRDSLCDYVGVPQKEQTLLFDNLEISKTIEPEQISGRDVLQAICISFLTWAFNSRSRALSAFICRLISQRSEVRPFFSKARAVTPSWMVGCSSRPRSAWLRWSMRSSRPFRSR